MFKLFKIDLFISFCLVIGRNPKLIWQKIEDAIRSIVLLKEPLIIRLLKNYNSKRNFFEMVRFDFAVDDEMNVFIMEVSFSFQFI